jgi:DNA-binding Xre family transcriptional regulator
VNITMVERVRILHGWTRTDLAWMAHVDARTVWDMMTGRRTPTFGTVQALCTALSLTLADVIVFVDDGNEASRGWDAV